MIKITSLLTACFLLLTLLVKAQTPPNAFNYSAVARDAVGQPIATTTIGIQIEILKNSPTGTSQYSENHIVNTDAFGLFNLVVGAGAAQSGSMATIDWSNDNYYLKVGLDATGGTNFLTMGITQLLSVPYAMHTKTAEGLINGMVINSVSTAGDTLYLSNGQTFVAGGNSGGTDNHYIGEEFGGGVIFHLWKDNAGVEHGLIVDKTDLSSSQTWSNIDKTLIGTSAQSNWDGLSNSNAIVGQAGHTSSASALCLNSTNGGQSDWYLPSIDELERLYQNRLEVNASLRSISGSTELKRFDYSGYFIFYWSSTELGASDASNFYFYRGNTGSSSKNSAYYVRAVRAF